MYKFINLDNETRKFMLEAIEEAEEEENLYYSTLFTPEGKKFWPSLLKNAAADHDEEWLAKELEKQNSFLSVNPKNGRKVPYNIAETFSFGQFNRYYILGLCKRAKSSKIKYLIVYRAFDTGNHREDSDKMINSKIEINEIEKQLVKVEDSLNSILVRPNSGLSLRIDG